MKQNIRSTALSLTVLASILAIHPFLPVPVPGIDMAAGVGKPAPGVRPHDLMYGETDFLGVTAFHPADSGEAAKALADRGFTVEAMTHALDTGLFDFAGNFEKKLTDPTDRAEVDAGYLYHTRAGTSSSTYAYCMKLLESTAAAQEAGKTSYPNARTTPSSKAEIIRKVAEAATTAASNGLLGGEAASAPSGLLARITGNYQDHLTHCRVLMQAGFKDKGAVAFRALAVGFPENRDQTFTSMAQTFLGAGMKSEARTTAWEHLTGAKAFQETFREWAATVRSLGFSAEFSSTLRENPSTIESMTTAMALLAGAALDVAAGKADEAGKKLSILPETQPGSAAEMIAAARLWGDLGNSAQASKWVNSLALVDLPAAREESATLLLMDLRAPLGPSGDMGMSAPCPMPGFHSLALSYLFNGQRPSATWRELLWSGNRRKGLEILHHQISSALKSTSAGGRTGPGVSRTCPVVLEHLKNLVGPADPASAVVAGTFVALIDGRPEILAPADLAEFKSVEARWASLGGDPAKSAAILTRALALPGISGDRNLKSRLESEAISILSEAGLYREAMAFHASLVQAAPADEELYSRYLDYLEKHNLFKEARQTYEKACATFRSTGWYDRLARFFVKNRMKKELSGCVEAMIPILTDSDLPGFIERNTAFNWGTRKCPENDFALKICGMALERFPMNGSILGRYARFLAWYDREAFLRLCARYAMVDPFCRTELLKEYARVGKLDDLLAGTIRNLMNGSDGDSGGRAVKLNLAAHGSAHLSKFEDAAGLFASLEAMFPSMEISMARAKLCRSLGYREDAGGILLSLWNRDRRLRAPLIEAGELMAELNDPAKAAAIWETDYESRKGDPGYHLELTTLKWDYFDYSGALEAINRARVLLERPSLMAMEAAIIHLAKNEPAPAAAEALAILSSERYGEEHDKAMDMLSRLSDRGWTGITGAFDKAAARLEDPGLLVWAMARHHRNQSRPAEGQALCLTYLVKIADPGILDEMAEWFSGASRHTEAAKFYARMAELTGRARLNLLCQAMSLERADEFEQAEGILENSLAVEPGSLSRATDLADFLTRRSKNAEATEVLITTAAAAPEAEEKKKILMKAIRKAMEAGLHEKATEILESLAVSSGQDDSLIELSMKLHISMKKPEGFKNFIDRTLKTVMAGRDPQRERRYRAASLRNWLVRLYDRMAMPTAALDQMIEIVNLNPCEATVTTACGYAMEKGLMERLRSYFVALAAASSKDPRWQMVARHIARKSGDSQEALKYSGRWASVAPENIEALTTLAADLMSTGDPAAAFAILRKAYVQSGHSLELIAPMVRALCQANDPEKLSGFLDEMTAREGRNAPLVMRTAASLLARGSPAEAYRVASIVLAPGLNPGEIARIDSNDLNDFAAAAVTLGRENEAAELLLTLAGEAQAAAEGDETALSWHLGNFSRTAVAIAGNTLPVEIMAACSKNEMAALENKMDRRFDEAVRAGESIRGLFDLAISFRSIGFREAWVRSIARMVSRPFFTDNTSRFAALEGLEDLMRHLRGAGRFKEILDILGKARACYSDEASWLAAMAAAAGAAGDSAVETGWLKRWKSVFDSGRPVSNGTFQLTQVIRLYTLLKASGDIAGLTALRHTPSTAALQILNLHLADNDMAGALETIEEALRFNESMWKSVKRAEIFCHFMTEGDDGRAGEIMASLLDLVTIGRRNSRNKWREGEDKPFDGKGSPVVFGPEFVRDDEWFSLAGHYLAALLPSRLEERMLRSVVEGSPGNPAPYLAVATALSKCGRNTEALDWYGWAAEAGTLDQDALTGLARVLAAMGKGAVSADRLVEGLLKSTGKHPHPMPWKIESLAQAAEKAGILDETMDRLSTHIAVAFECDRCFKRSNGFSSLSWQIDDKASLDRIAGKTMLILAGKPGEWRALQALASWDSLSSKLKTSVLARLLALTAPTDSNARFRFLEALCDAMATDNAGMAFDTVSEKLVEANPIPDDLLKALCRAAVKSGDPVRLEKTLGTVDRGMRSRELREIAELLESAGHKTGSALRFLDAAKAEFNSWPQSAHNRIELIRRLVGAGKSSEAKKFAVRWLDLFDHAACELRAMGDALVGLGLSGNGALYLKRALNLEPCSLEIRGAAAAALVLSGDTKAAADLIGEGLSRRLCTPGVLKEFGRLVIQGEAGTGLSRILTDSLAGIKDLRLPVEQYMRVFSALDNMTAKVFEALAADMETMAWGPADLAALSLGTNLDTPGTSVSSRAAAARRLVERGLAPETGKACMIALLLEEGNGRGACGAAFEAEGSITPGICTALWKKKVKNAPSILLLIDACLDAGLYGRAREIASEITTAGSLGLLPMTAANEAHEKIRKGEKPVLDRQPLVIGVGLVDEVPAFRR